MTGAGLGAGGGLLIGGAVGAIIRTDRWEEIPIGRLRVSFLPQRHGDFTLTFSLTL